jgi:hypothetical protein
MSIGQEDGAPQPLSDKLEFVKFSSITWTHDHKGFFYNRCRLIDGTSIPSWRASVMRGGDERGAVHVAFMGLNDLETEIPLCPGMKTPRSPTWALKPTQTPTSCCAITSWGRPKAMTPSCSPCRSTRSE